MDVPQGVGGLSSRGYQQVGETAILVALRQELDSLLPLSKIYQSKYPSAFKLETNFKEQQLNLNLIPGSLQTLMENAISESIISPTLPLKMMVTEENGSLLFKYPMNVKLGPYNYHSEKLELMEKAYNYYSENGIKTFIKDGMKTISLPLLEVEDE